MLPLTGGTTIGRLLYKLSGIFASIPSDVEGGGVPALTSYYDLGYVGYLELAIG